MHLVFTQVLINRCIVVENLDFHAFVSRIHTHWSTDTYSIVYTFLHETEFETEDEIAICLLGIEVATITIISAHTDSTVHRYIVDSIASPLTHVFAVEQNFKAFLRFLCREFILRRSFYLQKFFKHGLDVVDSITCISITYGFEASNRLLQHGTDLFATQGFDILGNNGTDSTGSSLSSWLVIHIRFHHQQSLVSMRTAQQANQTVLQLHIGSQCQCLAIRLELLDRLLSRLRNQICITVQNGLRISFVCLSHFEKYRNHLRIVDSE